MSSLHRPTERSITAALIAATAANGAIGLIIMPDASPAVQYVCLAVGLLLAALAVLVAFTPQEEIIIADKPVHSFSYTPIDLPAYPGDPFQADHDFIAG